MTRYATRDCSCTERTYNGHRRPETCVHGNRFHTEAELKPKERKPLRPVSEKRQAEEAAGTRAPSRGSTLKRGRGFAVHSKQREKVKGLACAGCGREESEGFVVIDPAHLWPRGKGGCDHPDCVIPLCRFLQTLYEPVGILRIDKGCHPAFDAGELDLLPRLADSEAWAKEQAHPILVHGVGLVELVRRLSGNQQELVWVDRDSHPQPTPKGI